MKKTPAIILKSGLPVVRAIGLGALVALALCGCKANVPQTVEDGEAALRAAGYSRAPVVTSVTQSAPDSLTIRGKAIPDGIVRFIYAGHRAGVTADSKGLFEADLTPTPGGGVYDISTEDGGRFTQAEGRLFVPAGQPNRSVLLRPGSSSTPLFGTADVLAVVDYDKVGVLAISGKVRPQENVVLRIDDEIVGRERSDNRGIYASVFQINPAVIGRPLTIAVSGEGGAHAERVVTLSSATAAGDHVTAVDKGWRVDWALPGGGEQTTFVF